MKLDVPFPVPGSDTAKLVISIIGMVLLAGVFVWAGWFVMVRPHHAAQEAAQAQTNALGQEAQAKAAEGSVAILRDHNSEVGRIQHQTENNSNDIHQAPGSEDRLSPDLDRAGRRALCLHDGRANDPQCQLLLHPDS